MTAIFKTVRLVVSELGASGERWADAWQSMGRPVLHLHQQPSENIADFAIRVREALEAHFGDSLRALQLDDHALRRARLRLRQALEPSEADVLNDMALAYRDLGDLPAARTTLERALELDPRSAHTLANLGNLRADAGEWDRARAYYLEALDLMTKTHDEAAKAVLFSDLGLVARETGQFEQAIQYYEHSLVLMRRLGNQGGVADAWRMIGRTFLIQRRYDDAIACCQTSQSIAERSRDELRTGSARYVLSQCYEETGRLKEAADLLEQVVYMDRKYQLPKLDENTKRLAALRSRLREMPVVSRERDA